MPVVDMKALRTALAPGQRILGLDLGEKTIGLAISDGTHTVASPVETLKRTKFQADAQALEAIMDARGCAALVLGLPISMDGSEGPRCQSVRQFAANFLARRDVPLAFWDERLSTASVERMLVGEADLSRRRRAQVVDKLAAAYILQGALDASRPA
ncbi:MAG: Holliday junction resolvase RuvX [Alphaproteobacteria bacterium]|nr:Holliday junction resolvase RuvX [Alphaproteobacteria bacterium]